VSVQRPSHSKIRWALSDFEPAVIRGDELKARCRILGCTEDWMDDLSVVDNPDDEQWVAKKGRRLAIWTGGAELKLTNQIDDTQESLIDIAADGTVSIVPPLGKNVLLGEGDGGAGLDFLVKRPLYLALVAFANTASTATTAAQIAVAAATLLTALQIPTPANPSSLTTVTKGA
jgi:hypothetical protein